MKSKFIILILMFLIFLNSGFANADNNLVAYYNFDEGTGTTASDSSGNGNTGTLVNNPIWVNGVKGKALKFDGVDDKVILDDGSEWDLGAYYTNFTISNWVKFDSFPTGGKMAGFIGHFQDADRAWMFSLIESSGTYKLKFADYNTRTYIDVKKTVSVSTGEWYHVAIIKNSTTYTFYLDGVSIGSSEDLPGISDFSGNVYIGCLGTGSYLNGEIDEMKVWDRALSDSEIKEEYEKYDTSLVAYYKFDDNVLDSAGDNNGVINGGAGFVDGVKGKALSFDGVDDYVSIGDSVSLSSFPNGITIESWIYPKDLPLPDFHTIVDKSDNNNNLRFHFNVKSGGALHYGFNNNYVTTQSSLIPLNSWHHIALVYDLSTVNSYVNGVLVNSAPFSGPIPDTARDLKIGTNLPMQTDEWFNGLIDELKIYNRALSEQEIKSLYDSYFEEPPKEIEIEISNATWQNMKGAVISQNDLNDRVKLDVKGENLEGKNIEFTLYKDVAWWFDEKISQTSSQAWTTWKTNESGVFYFKAKLSDRTEIQSGDLIVLEFQNDSFPISKIKKPKNRDIYFLNENIEFTQTSYDEDDFIDYTWDLGDGNLRNGSAEKNYLNYDFVYSYGVAGQKNIILNARSERGLDVKNKTSVLVIDLSENKKYVFADISVPWIKDSVKGNIVKFDASGSYAIEVLDGEIKCIAGNCPSQTSNGTLILNLNQLLDDLSFNWTFDDGSKRNGVGIGGAKFDKVFMNGGIKSVNLIVSINPFSETETEFVVFLENSVCDISSGGWWESGSFSLGMNDCYRINGVPSNFCCPQEYTCSGLEDGTGQCVFSEVQICSDYDNEEDCNNYELHVAEFDNQEKSGIEKFCSKSYYNQTDDCTYYRNCKCKWENSVCAPLYELNAYCSGEDKGTLLTCYRPNIETTNCTSSGYRYITWDGYYVDKTQNILKCISDFNCGDYSNNFENLYCNQGICASDVCSGGKKTIPCISTALLGFFDIINLIISLLIIVIFYVIVLRKSRSFKKDLLGK